MGLFRLRQATGGSQLRAGDALRGPSGVTNVDKTASDAGRGRDVGQHRSVGGALFKTLHQAIGSAPDSMADYRDVAFAPNTSNGGWHRGDGAFSIHGATWSLFCFNDFWVSDGAGGVQTFYRRNSVLMVDTDDGQVWWLSSGDGYPLAGSVTMPWDEPDTWMWLNNGGWATSSTSAILLGSVWQTSGSLYAQRKFQVMRVGSLTSANPTYSDLYPCGLDATTPIRWNSQAFTDGTYGYVYGFHADNWTTHVARVLLSDNPANYGAGAWEYYTGASWTTAIGSIGTVTVPNSPLRAINPMRHHGQWIAASKDYDTGPEGGVTDTWPHLRGWRADAVTGPWTYVGILYTPVTMTDWYSYAGRVDVLAGMTDYTAIWSVNTDAAHLNEDVYGPQLAAATQAVPVATDAGRGTESRLPTAVSRVSSDGGRGTESRSPLELASAGAEVGRGGEVRTLVVTAVATDHPAGTESSSAVRALWVWASDSGAGTETRGPLDRASVATDGGAFAETSLREGAGDFPAADVGRLTEVTALTETRSLTGADAGAGAETHAPVAFALGRSDAGAGAEADAVTGRDFASSDHSRLVEQADITTSAGASWFRSDTAALTEVAALVVTARFVTATDTGTGASGPLEVALAGPNDAGRGTETATTGANTRSTDAGTGADAALVGDRQQHGVDGGRLAETTEVWKTAQGDLERPDAAHFAEQAVVTTRVFASSDAGRGVEGQASSVAVAAGDTGRGAETVGTFALTLAAVDTGAGIDQRGSLGTDAVGSEASGGQETAQVARTQAPTTEAHWSTRETSETLSGAYSRADSSGLGESAVVTVVVVASDRSSAAEGRPAAELEGARDTAGLATRAAVAVLTLALNAVRLAEAGSLGGQGQQAGADQARWLEVAVVTAAVRHGTIADTTRPGPHVTGRRSAPRGVVDATKTRRNLTVTRR